MDKEKICLIRPPVVDFFQFATTSFKISPPLGLAYIAGALRAAGRQVTVIDAVTANPEGMTSYYKGYLVGLPLAEIVSRIPQDASVVGISAIFTSEWPETVHLIDLVKQQRPDVTVILGGEHITAMSEFCLATSKADILVLGEGEETIVELLDALDSGRPLVEIDGIAFRDEERKHIVVNKRRRRMTEVDSLAPPAWDLFDLETYHKRRYAGCVYSGALSIPLLATRGCPYQCTYCSAPNMWVPRWDPRDPIKVVDEIEGYMRKFGAGNFPFQDLTAIIRKDWIVNFCQEILRRGLKITWQFPTGTRTEVIDDEVAGLLLKSGMSDMAYAPESGSETTRKLIKKKMHTDKFLDSLRAASKAKLNVTTFFVIGFPHDTREHITENFEFLHHLAAEGVSAITTNYFMPLPGSELFYNLYDTGKIKIDRSYFMQILQSTTLWPAKSNSEHLNRFDLMLLKIRMFFEFYSARRSSPGYTPLVITTFQAFIDLFMRRERKSKLEIALHAGMKNALNSIRARTKSRWLSRKEENRMFAGWDAIYREIRRAKLAGSLMRPPSTDSSKLHLSNYVSILHTDHKNTHTIPLPVR